jgi:hypothetical protein
MPYDAQSPFLADLLEENLANSQLMFLIKPRLTCENGWSNNFLAKGWDLAYVHSAKPR